MKLGSALTAEKKLVAVGLTVFVASLIISLNLEAEAQYIPEYQRYVHNYLNSPVLGNWTYMEKPMFPVLFNDSQIPVGENWSIVCPLVANHSYHGYFYGAWVNNGSEPKTDYDIYVYDPMGELEGYHTQAAGLPEHLGTTVDEPFFVPKYSGNYTFVIANDARDSKAAEQATFMIIENVECNVWHEHYVEGTDNNSLPVFDTSWGYEFVTESQNIEVWIKVPKTLDMYEVRLYLMTDPESKNETVLNGVPLAWEPGLYGERNGTVGGYNLESKEYRGLAYASCEFYGQDMFLNFTSPYAGKSLYHLVFIGEVGSGTTEFLVKTEFNNTCLVPLTVPEKVYPYNDTAVAYTSNSTDLENATLQYSTDGWKNVSDLEMEILDNRTCRAVIPSQGAGAFVSYRVEADDVLRNVLVADGSYSVKYPSTLNISLIRNTTQLGENITVKGCLTPLDEDVPIRVCFTSANESREVVCHTLANGTFAASFKPETAGNWTVQARFDGDASVYDGVSPQLAVKVEEQSLFAKYSLYIGGGLGAVAMVGVVVYFRRSRE
jgi:hypothetical protein